MQVIIKVVLSVAIILAATAIGKKLPSTAGLVGVMPLTGALVLVWMYLESNGDANTMARFTKGALWGILPSILFFVVALQYAHKPGISRMLNQYMVDKCREFPGRVSGMAAVFPDEENAGEILKEAFAHGLISPMPGTGNSNG